MDWAPRPMAVKQGESWNMLGSKFEIGLPALPRAQGEAEEEQ